MASLPVFLMQLIFAFLGFSLNISKVISAVIHDCGGRVSGSGFSGSSFMLLQSLGLLINYPNIRFARMESYPDRASFWLLRWSA